MSARRARAKGSLPLLPIDVWLRIFSSMYCQDFPSVPEQKIEAELPPEDQIELVRQENQTRLEEVCNTHFCTPRRLILLPPPPPPSPVPSLSPNFPPSVPRALRPSVPSFPPSLRPSIPSFLPPARPRSSRSSTNSLSSYLIAGIACFRCANTLTSAMACSARCTHRGAALRRRSWRRSRQSDSSLRCFAQR